MDSLNNEIQKRLQEIKDTGIFDFSAVACMDVSKQQLLWRYVCGNRNDRYKRIASPIAKGICGSAIKSGRVMTMESFSPKSMDDPREYPLLVAEGLKALTVAPLLVEGRSFGVLLAGCRKPHTFTEDELGFVTKQATLIENLFSSQQR